MVRSLAWRSITSRKLRALLNGLGIVLGVALIFSIVSLSKTIVGTFDDLFTTVYGQTDILVTGANATGTLDAATLRKVRATKGVGEVATSVSTVMTLLHDGSAGTKQSDQINVDGVNPAEPDLSNTTVVAGRKVARGDELSIDAEFAARNRIKVGQKLRLATQSGVREFTVVGLLRFGGAGLSLGGQGFGGIPQETARRVADVPPGAYSQFAIKLADGYGVVDVKRALKRVVGSGAEVNTPSDISDEINKQIQGFTTILYIFAGMALFAGGYLILNSFNMTVAQRIREIGMLRTLGSSRKQIRRMILWEAVLLGVLGALAGIAGGLLLTRGMVALVKSVGFPLGEIKYPPAAFVLAPLVGLVATLFGALRPAIRAGRIPPIQAVLAEHRIAKLRLGRRVTAGTVLVALGLAGVFTLAAASSAPPPVVLAGVGGIVFLFTGVILVGPVVVPPLVRALAWPLRRLRPVEARLAADSARMNPVRTASTASGLMIGIALVGAIGALGASFIGSVEQDLDKQIKTDLTIQPKGFAPGQGPQQSMSPALLSQVRALPQAKLASGTRLLYQPKAVKGADALLYAYDPRLHLQFETPEYDGGGTAAEVMAKVAAGEVTLPQSLADTAGLAVGDKITLSGTRGSRRFRVAALMSGNSFESQSVGMSDASFAAIFGVPGYSQILVLATSKDARDALTKQVDKLLAARYPTFEALSNEQIKKQLERQLNQVFSIFYVIMAVAILVSLLGVVNTLLMNVLERTREIGLLRAIGSTRWQVRSTIAQEGLLLTVAGALLGLAVGMALGYAFVRGIASQTDGVSFHPPVGVIVGVAALAVLFGLLASILPARRAAHMNVIEAVSYE